ncbi:hypothetical protein ILUMI_15555 [Ignelater luminosus]|uniref:Uncharacterized protein n=1 Tax=Ignelater luminosus TaxID=2038154 RepID=A0A8K0CND1_IGNLU|nr:hypothetical protein ILUMI_15555 [Ignelater luminosus]
MKKVTILCFYMLIMKCLTMSNRCKCWPGYKPRRTELGVLECRKIHVNAYSFSPRPIPCNYPRKPVCACRSGFIRVTLADGTSCMNRYQKSACINADDFKKYLNELRSYIKAKRYRVD